MDEPAPTKTVLCLELFFLVVVVGSGVWFLVGLE
ncbi:hypothetical protein FIU95_13665 [Microbulbifer sp. THAF38]|nr:hypothetical protein FIU95_13665 [Microbulbifer sp. THAF38]